MFTKDLYIYRGDKSIVSFSVAGDHSDRNLSFVAKSDKEITTVPAFVKITEYGEVAAIFADGKTTVTLAIEPVDTDDLPAGKFYYDLQSVSKVDLTDVVTIVKGNLNLIADVQTPFDGYPLPGDPSLRYQALSALDGEDGDIVLTKVDADGNLVFDFSTVAKLYGFSIEAAAGEEGDLIQIKLLNGLLLFDFVSLVNLKLQLGL